MLLTSFRAKDCPLDLVVWRVDVVGDQDKWRDTC